MTLSGCDKLYQQTQYFHIQAFVQGFVLGKLLCTCITGTDLLEKCNEAKACGSAPLVIKEKGIKERASDSAVMVPVCDTSSRTESVNSPALPAIINRLSEAENCELSSSAGSAMSTSSRQNLSAIMSNLPQYSRLISRRSCCNDHKVIESETSTCDKSLTNSRSVVTAHVLKSHKQPVSMNKSLNILKDKKLNDTGTEECWECDMEFSSVVQLKEHARKHHNNKWMACHVCGKQFSGQRGLSIHMQVKHAGEKPAECDVCGQRFYSSDECKRHQSRDHGKKQGICHICGKHFRSKHSLNDHIKVHMGVKSYVCEHCGKSFLRYTTLWSHRKYLHSCKVCAKELVLGQCPAHPTLHQTPEQSSRPAGVIDLLWCVECKEKVQTVEEMEQHKKSHEVQRPFHCQICGKGFHTSASLSSHSKQHQEKQFQCDLCSKSFTYKCNMKKHRETHLDGQCYQCELCSKTFRVKDNLVKHKLVHLKIRRYKCHICGKGLSRLQHLKSHVKKMHSI